MAEDEMVESVADSMDTNLSKLQEPSVLHSQRLRHAFATEQLRGIYSASLATCGKWGVLAT